MTDSEAKLINDLRKLDAWSIKGGSLTLHFDGEGHIAQIETNRRFKLPKKISTSDEVLDLTK